MTHRIKTSPWCVSGNANLIELKTENIQVKILYITTIGATMRFFTSFIRELIDEGHTVEIATNTTGHKIPDIYQSFGCKIHHIDCSRSPLNKGNFKAVKQIKKLVSENEYDIVHCHTPTASACARIACKKLRKKKNVKVIYTAHGFHFYKGAPIKNWLMYYPVEWICSFWTDTLVTINNEDYSRAKKSFHAGSIAYVPGVGLDGNHFANVSVDKAGKREEIGVPEEAYMILSVGELNENKNHQVVIKALAEINNPDIHYVIVGRGKLAEYLQNLAESAGISEQVYVVGYRTDVPEFYKIADLFVHPSYREGLPVALMECLAAGTPCITSDIRGCADLVDSNRFDPKSVTSVKNQILKMMEQKNKSVSLDKKFYTSEVNLEMKKIYGIGGIVHD